MTLPGHESGAPRRKLIYSLMPSVDGFSASPDGTLDWVIIDEELHRYVNEQERHTGLFLYGRGIYEVMASYWPTADTDPEAHPAEVEYALIWQAIPIILFSRTLASAPDGVELRREVVPEEIEALKAQPGGNIGLGGPNLAATFLRLGLVDEIHIYVQPVVLGHGQPMFPDVDAPLTLRLLETHTFTSGVVFHRYEVTRPEDA